MTRVRLAVPDLISPSYFPAIAAVELGFMREEGLDAGLELLFPITRTYEALRQGDLDFVAGSAHPTALSFPEWRGAKLLMALAQRTYWFLVVRADLNARRGDLEVLKGLRIGAAPGVDLALKHLLAQGGIDPVRDRVEIGPVSRDASSTLSFGLTAARALEEGRVDGFWANGMGAEIAVRRGVGTVLLDARRGDGPAGASRYTFPALVATDATLGGRPEVAASAVRAVRRAQQALRADPSLATDAARTRFPPDELALIAELIRRDAPFYDARISEDAVDGMLKFSRAIGLVAGTIDYDEVVARELRPLWVA